MSLLGDEENQLQRLGNALSVKENDLVDEFDRFRNEAMPGTCQWIQKREWFQDWLRPDIDGLRVLWISGPPAAGKSVLAATTVDKIRTLYGESSCQYHNLSFADRNKRSASYLLRSLAFQVAHGKPLFLKMLLQMSEQLKTTFQHMSPRILWEKVFLGLLFQLMPERPLYWVIDGLDESDSIPTIFQCLNKIESDSLTLKIFLVSRPTADINIRVKSFQDSTFHVHHISHLDTGDDIRAYVSAAVPSIVPGSRSDHVKIINKILSKASGNFFWVALVLKALENNWYRKSDIDRVIKEFHSDMTPIYGRMMEKLDEQQTKDRKLASLILTWATFSFRPLTIPQLRTALEPEFRDLTSLEDIVRHSCVGFVQLHGSKVGLIHETAKHFLIHESTKYKIQMVPSKGHEYLAVACLQHLSSSRERPWRTILKNLQDDQAADRSPFGGNPSATNSSYPFLVYAAQSWAYHLSLARAEDTVIRDTLFDFFRKDALTWINTLALLGDLATVVTSAKYLKTFIRRREKTLEDENSVELRNDDPDDFKAWAKDLSRIVGKFGGTLLANPSAIYKLVPPFCPDTSMVKKYYGKTSNAAQNAFSVTGLSNPDWDDCHARRSFGSDCSASRVLATVDVFVALVPSTYNIVIWHAETCEELRRLHHGEYLREMAINKKGDLIATSGLKSIKIWDMMAGSLLATIPRTCETHVIALAFGLRDDEILSGYQDNTVISYNWRSQKQVFEFRARSEGDFFGGLNGMKFSPDGTQLAFAMRGNPLEVWDLRRRSRAYRYMIEEDASRAKDENLVFPEAIEWHPDGGRLYILYHNLRLVDWSPIYEEQKEYQVSAKDMVCSPDGNFLLTSDARGAIRIYALPDYVSSQDQRFRLIYHLEFDGLVRNLAFHPDGHRFYEVRESTCNVWQPEALVQPCDPGTDDDDSSNAGSLISSDPTEAYQEDCCQITAIASGPRDFGFCCGREDGSLSIHDSKTAKKLRTLPGHTTDTAIVSLVWSQSGDWIASADNSGHVLVRKIQLPSPSSPNLLIWKALGFHIAHGVIQMLISPDGKYLLVSSGLAVALFDIRSKTLYQSSNSSFRKSGRWAQHPLRTDLVIVLYSDEVQVFEWDQLRLFKPVHSRLFHRREQNESLNRGRDMTCVIQTRDEQMMIFETTPILAQGQDGSRKKRVEFFRTAGINDDEHEASDGPKTPDSPSPHHSAERTIDLENLPGLSNNVSRLVGAYQSQIIFFDHDHWLCSWDSEIRIPTYRKQLALPQDWLNDETLKLTTISPSGTLYCPRNGEVAIIRGGIKL